MFGNTGSASIPLTIVHHRDAMTSSKDVHCLLAGFGVGLSWGFADLVLRQPCIPEIVEI
jgi:3-oxoacyl-[acyl-carrier-protein] synthase III